MLLLRRRLAIFFQQFARYRVFRLVQCSQFRIQGADRRFSTGTLRDWLFGLGLGLGMCVVGSVRRYAQFSLQLIEQVLLQWGRIAFLMQHVDQCIVFAIVR
ncbi:hypothetical protein A989_09778 [Xanthomonas translucens DAR61454]|nr:hypothetical protein A989_09778 [Xanthomonas translucens DAR61454]